jgi:hypothetical protein
VARLLLSAGYDRLLLSRGDSLDSINRDMFRGKTQRARVMALQTLTGLRHADADTISREALSGVSDRPIVVGGSVRSGTTLLRMMLHSHPDVAIPREIHLTLETFRHRRRFGDLRKEKNRAALSDWLIGSGNGFERLLLDEGHARAALMAAPPTIGSLVGTLLRLYADRHEAPRFGDKRPLNVLAFPALISMFPDLQFVDMVRDPRAVMASVRKLGWLEEWHGGSLPRALDAWVRAVHAGIRIEARYRADQYLRIRYEDLLANPEANLVGLCRFAGLNDEGVERMLRFHETDHEIPPEMRQRYHPLIDRPLSEASRERWRSELHEEEIAFIESVAGAEMERFGYARAVSGIRAPRAMVREWMLLRPQRPLRRLRWINVSPINPYSIAAQITEGQRRLVSIGREPRAS